jgi:hypothetical protein
LWHAQVRQDEVEGIALVSADRRFGIGERFYIETIAPQDHAHDFGHTWFVIDHENARRQG